MVFYGFFEMMYYEFDYAGCG